MSLQCVGGAGVPGVKPVIVELTDFKTKEKVDELEVDAVLVATGRAPYTQVRHPVGHRGCAYFPYACNQMVSHLSRMQSATRP